MKKLGSKSFCWITGPLTTPNNLVEHLKSNNFEHEITFWGMYLPMEKNIEIPELQGLLIKEIQIEEMNEEIQKMLEKAYGMPDGSGKLLKQFSELYKKKTQVTIYIAYDGNNPVAFATLVVIPGTKGALMSGSATLQEYRRRSIYGNMLKVQKEKAKELGIEFLIIQANENTSAPIARKYGFEKVCTLDWFVYKPDKTQD